MIEDEVQQEEGDMLEDNIQDRDFTDALVGKKVKASYKNAWFIGGYQILQYCSQGVQSAIS